jgi:hypothetical protein
MKTRKTRQVCEVLGTNVNKIWAAMRSGKLGPPAARDCSGDFLWTEQEIEAARRALAIDLRSVPPARRVEVRKGVS